MPTTEIDGVRIAYEVEGKGRPLVFLHCWTGNKSFFFEQWDAFSRDYRCVRLDYPGHGDSADVEDREVYCIERFGEITVGLMEQLGIKKAVFVGHSLGGMVCQYLALEHPGMVEGIVLLDTTSHLSGFFFQRVTASVAVLLGVFGFKAAKALVAGIAATHPLANLKTRIITGRECSKVSNRSMVKTLDRARNYNVTDRLGEIKAPALVVVGTADLLADIRHAERLTRGIPNSTMKVVKGAGHMALFEKPDAVNGAIKDFLGRVYPPRPEKAKAKAAKKAKKATKKRAAPAA